MNNVNNDYVYMSNTNVETNLVNILNTNEDTPQPSPDLEEIVKKKIEEIRKNQPEQQQPTRPRGDHDYNHQMRTKGGGKGRRRKKTHRSIGKKKIHSNKMFKLCYANVQGKLGRYQHETWAEIQQMANSNKWDMMLFTETSWQGGIPPRHLPGYQAFHKQRPAGQKRGGGLAILVKDGITAYTWNPNREAWPQDNPTHSEILWLIIPSPKFDLAVGVIYLASGHKHKEWNEALHDALTQDIAALQEEGMKILLTGDFN